MFICINLFILCSKKYTIKIKNYFSFIPIFERNKLKHKDYNIVYTLNCDENKSVEKITTRINAKYSYYFKITVNLYNILINNNHIKSITKFAFLLFK